MSNFKNIEIVAFTPYIVIDSKTTFEELQAHLNEGERYATDDCLQETTAAEFLKGESSLYGSFFDSELECAEEYAADNDLISNEDELSERFDKMIEECYPNLNTDDKRLINETFSNYMDSLLSDGELHCVQVNEYTYVGEFN